MDEAERTAQPKISLPEGILILLAFVIIDGIELVLVFFAIDDFWIGDAISSMIFFYLFVKGVPPIYQFIAWIAELVPYLGALPLLTAGWLVTWWVDAHPKNKVGQVISTAASYAPSGKGVAGKIKGGVVEVAETEAKTAGTATRRIEETAAAGRDTAEEASEIEPRGTENISPEAFGIEKGPIEKIKEVMEELPEPELRARGEKEYNGEDDDSEFPEAA